MSLVTTKRSYPNGSFSGLVHSFKVPSPLFRWFKSSSPTAEIIARFNLCLDSFVKWFELCPFIKYWNKHWNSYQFPYLSHSPWNEYVQWYHSNAFSEVLCSMPGLLAQFRDAITYHPINLHLLNNSLVLFVVLYTYNKAEQIIFPNYLNIPRFVQTTWDIGDPFSRVMIPYATPSFLIRPTLVSTVSRTWNTRAVNKPCIIGQNRGVLKHKIVPANYAIRFLLQTSFRLSQACNNQNHSLEVSQTWHYSKTS